MACTLLEQRAGVPLEGPRPSLCCAGATSSVAPEQMQSPSAS